MEKEKPFILITNDDGIHAPGIKTLYHAVKDFADVAIVAPSKQQSGAGLSISLHKSLKITELNWECSKNAYHVDGTPADCIKLALGYIFEKKPDLILSGVNQGSNAGRNVLYSGTVGGIIEGCLRDLPGIAFSCEDFFNPRFENYQQHIQEITKYFLNKNFPSGSFLNVSFPACEKHEIQSIKMAKQGKSYILDNLTKDRDRHLLGAKLHSLPEHDDSDISMLKKNFIPVVPIHVSELTDHDFLEKHKDAFSKNL